MKKINLILILFFVILGLQSCNKEDNTGNEPKTGTTLQINSSDYKKWVYFSFETGEIVGTSTVDSTNAEDVDWKSRTDWDIAFHRQDIRTNSGESGNSEGGILEFPQTTFDFDAVTMAPETGYIQDAKSNIIYDMDNMKSGIIGYSYCGKSLVTDYWVNLVDMPNSVWVVNNKVFIVKTAKGKYAKIYLKNFKNDIGKSGTITMQYFYQDDGSFSLAAH